MSKTTAEIIREAVMKKKMADKEMAAMSVSNDNQEKHLAPIKPAPKKRDKITIAKPGQSAKGKIRPDVGKSPKPEEKKSFVSRLVGLISKRKK